VAEARLLNSRATWKVIASDMPLSLIVYDDAANRKGAEAFAQSDGPPRGRELEIADILRFIKTSGIANTVWLTADVHYTAAHYYNPDKAQFQDFEPFWEFVSGPLHAGTFGPNELDNTFGPEVKFIKAPGLDKQNLPPSRRHAVLRSRQDRGCHRTDDGDLARSRRRGAVVDDARSQTGLALRRAMRPSAAPPTKTIAACKSRPRSRRARGRR
jgi:phosphodiesterase/alkaline phosphatase D-like protein